MQSSKEQRFDVLVIGGGHVGLYTASKLAGLGYRVALIEKKRAIGEKIVCTGIISREAFGRFSLPEETIVGSIRSTRFYSPAGNHFDYAPDENLAFVVNRSQFNRHFESECLKRNVGFYVGQSVTKVRVRKSNVYVKTQSWNGEETTFQAQLVVLATGVNYRLFHQAGIMPPMNFLGGAQIHIPYPYEPWTSIFTGTNVAPGAFAWIVPLPSGVARVGLLSEQNPAFYLKRLLDQIRPGWRDDISESQIELRPVVQGPLERSFNDRVLVAGEAAGQIKTTTAGGIYYGLLGADAAIETIQKAFHKNRFSSDILSSYDKSWKKIMADELRMGHYFRRIFSRLTDDQIESLFEKVAQRDILSVAQSVADFDWHKGVIGAVLRLPTLQRLLQNPF